MTRKFNVNLKTIGGIVALIAFIGFSLSSIGQAMFSPGNLGEHQRDSIKCSFCHEPLRGVSDKQCLGCHKKVAAEQNNHRGLHSQTKRACRDCHQLHGSGEKELLAKLDDFNHQLTGFSLFKHQKQKCFDCHGDEFSRYSRQRCIACHRHLKEAKEFSNHLLTFPGNCLDCHRGRKTQSYKHKGKLSFFSSGHQVKCYDCHELGKSISVSRDCRNCHQSKHRDYNLSCSTCHWVSSWEKMAFKHKTNIVQGAHLGLKCDLCHHQESFSKLNFACQNCHTSKHRPSITKNCTSCHKQSSWKDVSFSHNSQSDNCRQCHRLPKGHFDQSCTQCHNTKSWTATNFEHPAIEEEHNHRSFPCENCHPNGYKSYSCLKCHKSNNVRGDEEDD